ncbi:hypothetical protein SAMN05216217_101350 [Halopseudomonas yangmingensis]|uniref:PA2779 family protein n=2 Tax=Halopseudomonas yangmingensis TaxID=1720063 RepID=A0A1I4NJ45_9GAMM|nr:hypothetical protein SAMN05216217_101350 [Halopseudomonas yangmingensis]
MEMIRTLRKSLSILMTALFLITSLASIQAQAGMIGTHELIAEQQVQMDRQDLQAMLEDDQVRERLQAMGVTAEQVEQRINSLTPAELAQFNAELEKAPAGAGVVGVIVLFLLVFIVTDMLCATNIYSFVNCVR